MNPTATAPPAEADTDTVLPEMFYYNPIRSVWIETSNQKSDQPALMVSFKNPMTLSYIEENVYLDAGDGSGTPFPFVAIEKMADEKPSWQTNQSAASDETAMRDALMASREAHTVWQLKPLTPLPMGQRINVKIRNTSPPSVSDGVAKDNVSNLTVYQFKTRPPGSSGYFQKIFDPDSWVPCDNSDNGDDKGC